MLSPDPHTPVTQYCLIQPEYKFVSGFFKNFPSLPDLENFTFPEKVQTEIRQN